MSENSPRIVCGRTPVARSALRIHSLLAGYFGAKPPPSIVVTTYQAGKLLVLGVHEGKLKISFLTQQPMGVPSGANRLAVGTRHQIHTLRAAHETAPRIEPPGMYDGCFVPRTSFYTGAIHGHDLAFGREGLWVVEYSVLMSLYLARLLQFCSAVASVVCFQVG